MDNLDRIYEALEVLNEVNAEDLPEDLQWAFTDAHMTLVVISNNLEKGKS